MLRRMILFFIGAAFLFCAHVAFADNPTPRPTRLPTPLPGGNMFPAWMTPPARGTTQADAGAVIYYYRCMACHGDKGQGLTIEWRTQWDVEHQNCARSTCHGARPPPEGFSFPKNFAPALIGANTLTKYENAQALFDFIRTRMPYQTPASLSHQEYWQLVAFLLRQRGVNVAHIDAANASAVRLHQEAVAIPNWLFGLVAAGFLLMGIGSWLVWREKRGIYPDSGRRK